MSAMYSGRNPDGEQRLQLNELLIQLERENPTESPASSVLLNGVWDLQFAGGVAPGVVTGSPTREIALAVYSSTAPAAVLNFLTAGPLSQLPSPLDTDVRDVSVTIVSAEAGQPRATTELDVTLLGQLTTLRIFANMLPASDVRIRQEFIEVEAFDQRTLLPGPLALTRSLYVTYLDEDLLVVRDESGVPEVLVRKDKFDDVKREPDTYDDASADASAEASADAPIYDMDASADEAPGDIEY